MVRPILRHLLIFQLDQIKILMPTVLISNWTFKWRRLLLNQMKILISLQRILNKVPVPVLFAADSLHMF
jgi:hypothetical protein